MTRTMTNSLLLLLLIGTGSGLLPNGQFTSTIGCVVGGGGTFSPSDAPGASGDYLVARRRRRGSAPRVPPASWPPLLSESNTKGGGGDDAAKGGGSGDYRNQRSYGDDAFGFIFLNSAFFLRDGAFASSFLATSAIAAAAVSAGTVRNRPWLPGAVAFASLAFGKAAEAAAGGTPLGSRFGEVAAGWGLGPAARPALGLGEDEALFLEVAACALSLVWGVVREGNDGSDK